MTLMSLDEAIQQIYGIDDATMAKWQREREMVKLHRALWRIRIRRGLEALAVEYTVALFRMASSVSEIGSRAPETPVPTHDNE